MAEVGGDKVEGNVEDGKNIIVGKGINQDVRESSATGNTVYVYPGPPLPAPRPGELMADAANELWKAIAELNQIMGGLTSNVAANTRATEKQAQSIHELARTTEDLNRTTKEQGERTDAQFRDFRAQITTLQRVAIALRPLGIQVPDMPEGQVPPLSVRQSPWWQPYATPLLLAAILIVLVLSLGVLGGGS